MVPLMESGTRGRSCAVLASTCGAYADNRMADPKRQCQEVELFG
jgi:hypothetical protein